MTSATLKVLNAPTFPIQPEPNNRKKIILIAFFGSISLIFGFFLIVELLDRTLRDKVRTERLTKVSYWERSQASLHTNSRAINKPII